MTNFYVSISQGNNCVGIRSDIMMVRNIILYKELVYVVVQNCLEKKEFFSYPVQSSFLGIHQVHKLSDNLELRPLSEVSRKYVCLQHRSDQVVIPLLHTQTN